MSNERNPFDGKYDVSGILSENFLSKLFDYNNKPIPNHKSSFKLNEKVVIKNYTYEIVLINNSCLVLEPCSCFIEAEEE